jgi:D-galactose 1-dehydrogenase/L-arabinose 1- dehydrogenase
MSRESVRLALVGIGKIARDQHCPALAADSRFQLVATVSRHGTVDEVPAFTDIAAMLRSECGAEAVSLCTPPNFRYSLAREALDAGLHVMLEKPPGATLGEVKDLEDRAARAGLTLFATWHSREADCVDEARAWLAQRKIESVRVTWKEDIRRWHPGQHWILEAGGFGVFDPGINALSILCSVLPEAPLLEQATLHIPANRQSPIAAQLEMRLPSGARVDADFDFLQTGPQTWDIEIDTDGGRLLLSEGGRLMSIDGKRHTEGHDREYARLYARFAELIAARASDVDIAPLRIVADAFLIGHRVPTAAFDY